MQTISSNSCLTSRSHRAKFLTAILLAAAFGFAAEPARGATCFPAPAGLVSWWGAENDAADTAGANPGTLQNGAKFAAGKSGNAFSLDGTNDYILVSATPSLNVGLSTGFTIEGWIKPTALSGIFQPIAEFEEGLGTHANESVGVQFHVTAGGGPGCLFANVKDTLGFDHIVTTTPGLIVVGAWQHVALSYDRASGMVKMYRNGLLMAASYVGSYTPQTSSSYLVLGARTTFGSAASPSDAFPGLIDELSVYSRALSDAEIQAIYNADDSGKCSAPRIVTQPQSQVGFWGKPLSLTVAATGAAPLAYQWQRNGAAVAGATASVLSFPALDMTNGGAYRVVVTNYLGGVTSSVANLTVNPSGVSIALHAGVTIDGVAGFTYGIQSTTNLDIPASWIGVTNVTLKSPVETWFDPQPASLQQLYYQVVPGPISIP